MNRIIAFLLFACSGADALAQGQVQFRNYWTSTTPAIDAPVYFGWDMTLRPNASNPLWRAALIGGPTTATAASWNTPGTLQMMYSPVNTTFTWVNFRSGSTPPMADGYVNVGTMAARVVPGVDWGGTALVQMVVWQGNYNTWAEAYAAAQSGTLNVFVGFSNPLTLRLPSGPTSPSLTYLWGLQSFSFGPMSPPITYFHGISGPYNQTVDSGAPARFYVSVDAWPAPYSYSWYRNGIVLPGEAQSSFNIASTSPADNASMYYLVVNHQLGTFTSQVATLTVATAPPAITNQPQSQTALFGVDVQLGATASGAWPRKSMVLQSDQRHSQCHQLKFAFAERLRPAVWGLYDRGQQFFWDGHQPGRHPDRVRSDYHGATGRPHFGGPGECFIRGWRERFGSALLPMVF